MARCNYTHESCNKKQALIIGFCKFCKKNFCTEHRLPESHHCEFLNDCKSCSFVKNKEKLLSEASNQNHSKISTI